MVASRLTTADKDLQVAYEAVVANLMHFPASWWIDNRSKALAKVVDSESRIIYKSVIYRMSDRASRSAS